MPEPSLFWREIQAFSSLSTKNPIFSFFRNLALIAADIHVPVLKGHGGLKSWVVAKSSCRFNSSKRKSLGAIYHIFQSSWTQLICIKSHVQGDPLFKGRRPCTSWWLRASCRSWRPCSRSSGRSPPDQESWSGRRREWSQSAGSCRRRQSPRCRRRRRWLGRPTRWRASRCCPWIKYHFEY